jgi:hypothetical protein
LFQSVGAAEVDRDNSSGDLTFVTSAATCVCFDLSHQPPLNFTGRGTGTITGGTGKNAGITGTSKFTFHGQILTADAAGHAFVWSEGTSTERINRP